MEWVTMIITALASGGLAGIGSLWYAKRRAKAEVSQVEVQTDQVQLEVVKSVQDVYNRTIERLQQDRDELNTNNKELQAKITVMERELSELQQKVSNNEKKLAFLLPITCCVKDCKDRILFTDGDEYVLKRGRKRNEVHGKRDTSKEDKGV